MFMYKIMIERGKAWNHRTIQKLPFDLYYKSWKNQIKISLSFKLGQTGGG